MENQSLKDQDLESRDHGVSRQGRRGIFVFSLSAHFMLVLLPYILFLVFNYLNPPLVVTKVSLVDSPPNEWDRPSLHPDENNPNPIFDEPKLGDIPELSSVPDIPELPPEPQPEPPAPEPPKPEPPKPPEPKPEPKPDPKPVVVETPKPKPESPKPPEKKPEPPKSTLLRPEDIKTTGNRRVTNTNPTPTRPVTTASNTSNKNNQAVLDAVREMGSPTGNKNSTLTPGGAGGAKGVVSKDFADYYVAVDRYLRPLWNPPGEDVLGGARPFVEIAFKVDDKGRILSKRIVRKSGIAVMDASVEQLLSTLTVLPKPPQAMELTATMRINN